MQLIWARITLMSGGLVVLVESIFRSFWVWNVNSPNFSSLAGMLIAQMFQAW